MNGRKGKYTVIHHIYKIEYYTKMRKTNRTNLLLLVKNGGILVVVRTGRGMRKPSQVISNAILFLISNASYSGEFVL